VPITVPPLVTEFADNDRLCSASLPIVNVVVTEPLEYVAVRITAVDAGKGAVWMSNV
jgi:hypothetical protein